MQPKAKFNQIDLLKVFATAAFYVKDTDSPWFALRNPDDVRIDSTHTEDDTLLIHGCAIILGRRMVECQILGRRRSTTFVVYAVDTSNYYPEARANPELALFSCRNLEDALATMFEHQNNLLNY